MSNKWLNQQAVADRGPVSVNRSGDTWRDHLFMAGLLLALLIGAAKVTSAMDRGLSAIEQDRAFCAEIDQRFVSSRYYFDEVLLECRVREDGDNG